MIVTAALALGIAGAVIYHVVYRYDSEVREAAKTELEDNSISPFDQQYEKFAEQGIGVFGE